MTNPWRVGVSLLAGVLFLYGGNLIAGTPVPADNFPKPGLFEPDVAIQLFVGSFVYVKGTTKLFPADSLVQVEPGKVELSKLKAFKLKFILIRPNRDKMHTPPVIPSGADEHVMLDAGSRIAIFQDVNPYPQAAKPGKGAGPNKDKAQIAEGGGWFFSPTITAAVNQVILHPSKPLAMQIQARLPPGTTLGTLQTEASTSTTFLPVESFKAIPATTLQDAILGKLSTGTTTPSAPKMTVITPHIRILCATVDLNKPPFSTSPYSPFVTTHGTPASDSNLDSILLATRVKPTPGYDPYDTAARWVLAYYAANSNASKASSSEVGAAAFLWKSYTKVTDPDEQAQIVYTLQFAGIPNGNPGFTSLTSFTPDADLQSLADFITTSIFGPTTPFKLSGSGSLPAPYHDNGAPAAVPAGGSDPKAMTDTKTSAAGQSSSSSGGFPYKFSKLKLPPNFQTDNTGIEVGDSVTFSRRSDNAVMPKNITFGGDDYIDKPYYDVHFDAAWQGDTCALDPMYTLSRMPQGAYTLWKQEGSFQGSLNPDGKFLGFTCSTDFTGAFNEQKNNAPGKSFVDTDDYRGTAHAKEVGVFYPDNAWLNRVTMGQWVEADHSTQQGDFFAPAAANIDYTGDAPSICPWSPDELIHYDVTLSGGGIMGQAPATSLIYGGNAAGSTSLGIPQPVLHSFGTGKLGVFSSSTGSLTGAVAYGSLNGFVAIPVGLKLSVFSPEAGTAIENALNDDETGIGGDDQNKNQIHYFTESEKTLQLRPIAVFDAVWLGAPAGYDDRTTLATGGGAELSLYGFNMDFVYALTISDTARNRQPLGANPIFQMSYDLHF